VKKLKLGHSLGINGSSKMEYKTTPLPKRPASRQWTTTVECGYCYRQIVVTLQSTRRLRWRRALSGLIGLALLVLGVVLFTAHKLSVSVSGGLLIVVGFGVLLIGLAYRGDRVRSQQNDVHRILYL
jgi:peptidoglycan/LPS O-acetylase OafA/YrhL